MTAPPLGDVDPRSVQEECPYCGYIFERAERGYSPVPYFMPHERWHDCIERLRDRIQKLEERLSELEPGPPNSQG